jgi:nitrilase
MSIPRAKEILMKIVKAAAVQLSPVLYSREETVEKVTRKIQELGGKRVQFATFPEPWCPTTRTFRSSRRRCRTSSAPSTVNCPDKAVMVPSASTEAISEAARQAACLNQVEDVR